MFLNIVISHRLFRTSLNLREGLTPKNDISIWDSVVLIMLKSSFAYYSQYKSSYGPVQIYANETSLTFSKMAFTSLL